jgi:hypothetical protein
VSNLLEPLEPVESLTPLETSKSTMSNSALLMKKIAEDSSLEGMNVNGEKLINKTKLFLVAQACNELNRVIKLTNLLDKLENKFIETISDRLETNPDNLTLITSAMETITEALNRSNALITQVLKDDKLSSIIINTTNIITPEGKSSSLMTVDSRDAVRNAASFFLAQLQHLDAEILEAPIEEEDSTERIDDSNESKA